jgi:outer membrane protein W
MGNATWTLQEPAARLRPYVSGGAGIARATIADALDAFSSRSTLVTGNVAAGVNIRLRPRASLNLDVRYFRSTFDDGYRAGFGEAFVAFTRLSGGVILRF